MDFAFVEPGFAWRKLPSAFDPTGGVIIKGAVAGAVLDFGGKDGAAGIDLNQKENSALMTGGECGAGVGGIGILSAVGPGPESDRLRRARIWRGFGQFPRWRRNVAWGGGNDDWAFDWDGKLNSHVGSHDCGNLGCFRGRFGLGFLGFGLGVWFAFGWFSRWSKHDGHEVGDVTEGSNDDAG